MNNKAEYTPEKVVDISNLSREDWLEYRKKGIGGSDVAAIMGISPFATIRDLFYNKTGVQPVIQEEEESNWVAKEVGHRLEDLVAEIFSKKTGLEVFPVRVMFRHPLYPGISSASQRLDSVFRLQTRLSLRWKADGRAESMELSIRWKISWRLYHGQRRVS